MNSKHEKAYTFLNHHRLGVLGTVSATSEPWGAAIYYTVNKHLTFYFITHVTTLKYDNMQRSHRASLTVVDDETQTTVQAVGDITELADTSDEYSEAYSKLAHVRPSDELGWTPPVSKMHTGKTALFKLTPTSLRFADFDSRQPSHDSAEQII
ncbi:MAG TPA: pyridoxamine 5'-phosphate oxidase family protein [Magnetospirillaceae bacterium]|nr:pyridoxamine 5'-phosphate oxidase family protein [Magnetospirillaceae bacterium]